MGQDQRVSLVAWSSNNSLQPHMISNLAKVAKVIEDPDDSSSILEILVNFIGENSQ
jgi:hypothetical protein